MLVITYQYECDICKQEIREPQTFLSSIYAVLPPPMTANRVGQFDVCEDCLGDALTVYDRSHTPEKKDGAD